MEIANRRRKSICAIAVLSQLVFMSGLAVAQVKTYTAGDYPAPKLPPYKLDVTTQDLLPMARVLVRKPAERQPLTPGYAIKPGEKVLILVSEAFDDRVVGAIRQAIEEVGGKPDVVKTFAPPRNKVNTNIGYEEVRMFASFGLVDGFAFPKALQAAGKYDMVINGEGGPVPVTPYKWEYIPWSTVDKFMFSQASFPFELQKAIDNKAWDNLLKARKIHVTDPEGTDMTWNWNPQYAAMLREEWPGYAVVLTGHLGSFPEFLSPLDADAHGTIGGTLNHMGTFPYLKITVDKNQITKIEGGGEYGKQWQGMIEACKSIQYPGFPAPGCGWFEEAAIGSDAWRARSLGFPDYPFEAAWERGRSGVIHWGLGVSRNVDALPAVQKWYKDNKTPAGGGHWHVHTYFTTMDFTFENGKQFRLIDKGHLTLLDDPEIRKIAEKYGNPDEILKEKWVPAIPGINVPGDYMAEYAKDPFKLISQQHTELMQKLQGK